MSPKTERFTRKHIDYLAEFKAPQLSVELSDFQKALKHRPSVFAYCDPPYFLDGKCLYGKQHLDFNHEALHRILRKRKAWLLSYDDCPEVRELYSGFRIKTVSWCYGMANQNEGFDGTSKEVLILSDDIIEPQELQPSLF
jgi:DNA adenine methylase